MATQSTIEWTEQTWNPTTGCTKISPGCKNCYAAVMARRLHAMGASGYENEFELTVHPTRLDQPMKRKKPTVYFVNSMSDLFHEDVPDTFIDQVFSVIENTPQHTYQILTKRAERLPAYFKTRRCPKNVWLGVSVEDQKYGVPRIDYLRQVDAHIRFLSVEPLLEDLGTINLKDIHWVIVGGESGHKARPMKEAWLAGVKRQADAQGSAFFFKQWGGGAQTASSAIKRPMDAFSRAGHGMPTQSHKSRPKIPSKKARTCVLPTGAVDVGVETLSPINSGGGV